MTVIVEPAPAKINLALHVRRRRDDGYHELETLFAFCRDGDVVTVERAGATSLTLTGPFAKILAGEVQDDNLVMRAARGFVARFGVEGDHAITLDKHLPVASGIGGGSADAAATLRALAKLHGVAVDHPELFALAGELGADVPACLLGRIALGQGKGDALQPLASLGDRPVLLVNPGVGVSTAAVFARWDGVDRGGLGEGDVWAMAAAGRNDLEPPARALAPAIDTVLALLAQAPGVVLSRMSGSGATCFAVFESVEARDAAARAAMTQGWWGLPTFLS
ncbi:4-(cytidine 5'-diphospho)-2-C-methyl-D-erythritol kinase [Sphingomonas sp. S17]|jgi:4-diphosphocytidyl-2-C-methyl-D-erythritol kinase|uniref:4-diphosphocytidyl-2-C-methyl-D-erythritol kinase n=2 Tax=Sphingomonas paucimobilis TaxID=13689 RepID=A0A411LF21_SPHPI|nr:MULTISPECIES: 4-(cytidine 5'-diphospho)-2-C-methyl-D-erythritol kinase [Sphingomonas]EGI56812.1 4-(cytidine 5'-diphospho)-2-C-methyl-D-erythritol kinase [Sphingomonas sp. S17]MCM3678932.1 4-(cytidine 5'-diphospho)-2-C-methyl-D-erythritol kinase [Sphingomonas paucimobilis]MDG5971684.1 4-(cytidine 5'-diphospho)-2-C-methyl-D-erythritol kinase [Sphingomonas paucimobilis]NNG58302.1 4-(cytidine 5'-diphospho)-2-C-methyl-D-erythritol kinase [Sphingomonas paucimobilis]QBE90934.1 4-(cytidine 5'-dipho